MKNSRKTTMEDVARAVGVSRTTVSFVLNDRPDVRIPVATRERVRRAARELGYRPHNAARALASQRTGQLGLVSEIVTSPLSSATIRGIHTAARQAGYSLFIVPTTPSGQEDPEAFETLLKARVEGIIYATGWPWRRAAAIPDQAKGETMPTCTCTTSGRRRSMSASISRRPRGWTGSSPGRGTVVRKTGKPSGRSTLRPRRAPRGVAVTTAGWWPTARRLRARSWTWVSIPPRRGA